DPGKGGRLRTLAPGRPAAPGRWCRGGIHRGRHLSDHLHHRFRCRRNAFFVGRTVQIPPPGAFALVRVRLAALLIVAAATAAFAVIPRTVILAAMAPLSLLAILALVARTAVAVILLPVLAAAVR